ncbi:MAG: hypothetical protein RML36_15135 [Anaerolineae bacterium]|nr:hypothetical protein [Anaerolineae bacterium]MDW8100805.1 hypothetical protein [Anaerolineae bacterium]
MAVYYIGYELQDGYIHHWLVAGPQTLSILKSDRLGDQELQLQIARHYYEEDSGVAWLPVERGALRPDDEDLSWYSVHCLEDHFVDLSGFHPTCHYLRAWAYARVASAASQEVTFVLTTHGPADLWLNGRHLLRQERFADQAPHSISFPALLQEGHNEVLVRFEQVGLRACPYRMALRILGFPSDTGSEPLRVLLPIPDRAGARRQTLERVFEAAYLDRDVYAGGEHIFVRWPDDLTISAEVMVRLQRPSGRIYAEAHVIGKAGDHAFLGRPWEVPEGPYQAVLMPRPREYYDQNMRIQRKIDLWVLNRHFFQQPQDTYEERRLEALDDAARREEGLFTEIAKMELGRWPKVKADAIEEAIQRVHQRKNDSNAYLLGLLGMVYRYGKNPSFPSSLQHLLEKCILEFPYGIDEPGDEDLRQQSESHQILSHACELLAGQLYPRRVFVHSGKNGRWHRERGEQKAISWLHRRGLGGFREWDAPCSFERIVLALSHLMDLARNRQVWELAAVVMDKLFFTMALNSYRGVFGSTHGHAHTPMIKTGRLEATAGISRLMWGMGAFNHHLMGTVSLACAKEYELPSIISDIAADLPEEMWDCERHAGELEEWRNEDSGSWEVNKVTYKTPDYMLCSAQDYHPGERGSQEHIWQATLGPDAIVFVTHPPCMSEKDSVYPNFWLGNAILPRVAQWRDVLIAIYRLPDDDWLGFTHAYFPAFAFDEHVLRDGWAFARKGKGYLALTASQGLEFVTRGPSAYRELRSHGHHNIWLCHMGRAAQDGGFGEFQERVLALNVAFEGLSARCTTLRSQSLAFSWEGPLLVDGKVQPITGFKHYENPYCMAEWPAQQMEIRFGENLLRLKFGKVY